MFVRRGVDCYSAMAPPCGTVSALLTNNYFNPSWHPNYRRGDLHTLQVVSKTVTSATIGVAGTRHEFPSLDTPVLKFFDESKVANVDERKGRMTIRHLLTMTAGLEWHENVPYNDPRNSSSHGSSGGLGAVRD